MQTEYKWYITPKNQYSATSILATRHPVIVTGIRKL